MLTFSRGDTQRFFNILSRRDLIIVYFGNYAEARHCSYDFDKANLRIFKSWTNDSFFW